MAENIDKVPYIEPLLVDAQQASEMLGIGRSHFYAMLSSGQIGPMSHKLGKRCLYSVKELRKWVNAGMPTRQDWLEEKKL
jgi:predicted DNA-binding transcriptional regulator AlpA